MLVAGAVCSCRRMWALLQLHAKQCTVADCPVLRCRELRQMRRLQMARQEEKRRVAYKNMLRNQVRQAACPPVNFRITTRPQPGSLARQLSRGCIVVGCQASRERSSYCADSVTRRRVIPRCCLMSPSVTSQRGALPCCAERHAAGRLWAAAVTRPRCAWLHSSAAAQIHTARAADIAGRPLWLGTL